jgi:hypothetical protein
MIHDKAILKAALDRCATGVFSEADIVILGEAIERLDELDDLVDTICTCRTQEIPTIKLASMAPADCPPECRWHGHTHRYCACTQIDVQPATRANCGRCGTALPCPGGCQ